MAGIAFLALATGTALAAPGDLVSVKDGDDTPVVLDLAQLDVQQNRDKRMQAKFTFFDAFTAAHLAGAASGPPGSICLRLYISAKPSAAAPEYLACVVSLDGRHFRGSMLKDTENGGKLTRVGGLSVTHPNSRTLIVRFATSLIGKPTALRFAGEATQQLGCPQPHGCFDRVPNSVRTRSFAVKA